MRYDDTLETVLASDLSTGFGKQSAWRQLVDLIGRRRIGADSRALAVLREIQPDVPPTVRAASARGLEWADPPAPLVRLLARDILAVAAPILRTARLSSAEWIQMLAELGPEARGILRHRRDLGPQVQRALAAFGPHDFVLADARAPEERAVLLTEPEAAAGPPADRGDAVGERAETSLPADGMHVADDVTAPEVLPEERVDAILATEQSVAAPEPARDPIHLSTEIAEGYSIELHPTIADTGPDVQQEGTPPAREGSVTAESLAFDVAEFLTDDRFEADARAVETMPAPTAEASPVGFSTDAGARIEEDTSYLDFAIAGAALPATVEPRQDVPETNVVPPQGQTETVATPAEIAAVAGPADATQIPDMLEQSEIIALHDDDHAGPDETVVGPDALLSGEEADVLDGPFQIADVVARIDAFWRTREAVIATHRAMPRADGFRFETDSDGVIRWVDGVSRNPIVGISLELHGGWEVSRVDGVAAGAFRRRAVFTNARLEVVGNSDAAGAWLISGVPAFEPVSGRFTGYRGTARRPRSDERAEPLRPTPVAPDSLRQLVHELRTPTNAIAGFAEMIESEILGPVPDEYRDRAAMVRGQARDLLGAIDDLDLAARIESTALALSPVEVPLRPMLATICDDLAQLTALRGSWIALPIDDLGVRGDRRAIERLLSRLMATLVSASAEGERIGVRLARDAEGMVAISIDRPRALAEFPGEALLGIDDEGNDVTLLGTGFALRLARNLARELGGSMVIEPENLTLRLPASEELEVEQAHLN